MLMTMLKELTDLILEKSLKVADEPVFELSSGRKSNLYIDCRKTTKNARGAYLIGNIIYEKISGLDVDAIGGLTMGADPVADAVAYTSVLKGKLINSFSVRKKAKEHGLKRVIEGDVKSGDRVVIVDDVATTGQSTIEAIENARAGGLTVVKVIILVDRQEGGRENILKHDVDFEAVLTKEDLLKEYYKKQRNS
ncbi:MAG: orotate phosphoribosyltransferase [Nitrospirae bacterium]|nr:orotate phosphoribosyltransferase [Nitrospirota bacterium]